MGSGKIIKNINFDSTDLRDTPGDEEWSFLGVGQHATSGVVESKVRGTIDNDTLDGYTETSVQTTNTIGFEDFRQTVTKTCEFTTSTCFTYISGQP